MKRTKPELTPLLQASAPHQREVVSYPAYDLTCSRPNTRRILSTNGFRNLELSSLDAETLQRTSISLGKGVPAIAASKILVYKFYTL
ncbi:hypothetical protein AVEN_19901-1 [Araneus ventricosus]|uniref:Uncharacterized protein n=1 Tax=Araneus ventricosus TaxID=182803 RepID=A0A4Y2JCR8_ARAVE|nr:hypothetical protein AVEN_19901-1 [Araneus ventricosus]